MKNRFIVAGLLTASCMTSAQAAEVDVTAGVAGDAMLGQVSAGQYGTIANDYSANAITGGSSVGGVLGKNEEIIFTYSFTGLEPGASLISSGGNLTNFAYATSFAPPISSGLVVASANLPSLSGGMTAITNKTGANVLFSSFFSGFFSNFSSANSLKLSYKVISTVPLPASLGMFGSLMLGMFGFSWFKRRQSGDTAV